MMSLIQSRGSGKTVTSYIVGLRRLYASRKISKEDYIGLMGAALVTMFGYSEDGVLKWMEQMVKEDDVAEYPRRRHRSKRYRDQEHFKMARFRVNRKHYHKARFKKQITRFYNRQ